MKRLSSQAENQVTCLPCTFDAALEFEPVADPHT
jgi:hypothetical protein